MKRRIGEIVVVVTCAWAAAFMPLSCALTSKAELVKIRYFSPERVRQRSTNQAQGGKSSRPLQLRFGRVSSGPNLRERIAYRNDAYEVGYYDDLRWTERPETFLRRELAQSLFATQEISQVVGMPAPTLDVELIAFDEVRLQVGRSARIQLKFTLYEGDTVLVEETLTVERAVLAKTSGIEEVVAAMASALDAAAGEVAAKVGRALIFRSSQPPSEPLL